MHRALAPFACDLDHDGPPFAWGKTAALASAPTSTASTPAPMV